jgi:hypothetical protein
MMLLDVPFRLGASSWALRVRLLNPQLSNCGLSTLAGNLVLRISLPAEYTYPRRPATRLGSYPSQILPSVSNTYMRAVEDLPATSILLFPTAVHLLPDSRSSCCSFFLGLPFSKAFSPAPPASGPRTLILSPESSARKTSDKGTCPGYVVARLPKASFGELWDLT